MNGDDDDGALADHDEGFNDDGPTLRTLAAAISEARA